MSNSEIIPYRPGSVDISRTGGRTGDDAGGIGGGQHGEARDTPEVAKLRSKIAAITMLAHTGRERDEARYRESQGELRSLTAQLVAAQGGRAVATGDDAPARPSDFPNLPADSVSRQAWIDAKPELAAAGITVEQSRVLGRLVLQAEQDDQQRLAAAVEQRRADSKRALARLYGAGWEGEVRRGNSRARELLPDGAAAQLFAERLADGSVLGDHEMVCGLMIELARDRR